MLCGAFKEWILPTGSTSQKANMATALIVEQWKKMTAAAWGSSTSIVLLVKLCKYKYPPWSGFKGVACDMVLSDYHALFIIHDVM